MYRTDPDTATLDRTTQPAAVSTLSKRERLEIASRAFNPSRTYSALPDLEGDIDEVRAQRVAGSILEPISAELAKHGIPTDGTVGSAMDGLMVSQDELHTLACECFRHDVQGCYAASRFRIMAEQQVN